MGFKNMEIDLTSLEEKKFQRIPLTEVLSKALLHYNDSNYTSLIVIDPKDKVQGILTVDQILKANKPSTMIKKMIIAAPLLHTPTLDTLAKIYVDKNIDLIPIVDKFEKLTRVVSIYKLARDLLIDKDFDFDTIVEPCPILLHNDATTDNTLSLLRKNSVDIIPIIDQKQKNRVIGILPIKDLIKIFHEENSESIGEIKGEKNKFIGMIGDFILDSFSNYVIPKQEVYKAEELIEKMESNYSQTLFVIDANNTLLGMIKMRNLVKKLLDESGENDSGFSIHVQGAPDENIESIAFKKVNGMLQRYQSSFGSNAGVDGQIRFKKIEHQSRGGMFSYETQIRIEFGKGKDEIHSVSAIDWGAEKSLNKAFNKLSRLLNDKRKIIRDNTRETLRTSEI